MSDRRVRELERRYHETGATEDEAAMLRERLRVEEPCGLCQDGVQEPRTGRLVACPACTGAGSVLMARLKLAAYLGHPASREVLGTPGWDAAGDEVARLDLSLWVSGLSRWGQETMARASVAAGWVAWRGAFGDDTRADLGVYPHHSRRRALRAAETCIGHCGDYIGHLNPRGICTECRVACQGSELADGDPFHDLVTGCYAVGPGCSRSWLSAAIRGFAGQVSESTVRGAIQAALIPWALADRWP